MGGRVRPGGSRTQALWASVEGLESRRLLSAAIAGVVFNDADADGVRDPSEGGMPGQTVYLDANANGTRDAGEAGMTSAADGTYVFNDLAAGTYLVRLAPNADFAQTFPLAPGGTSAGHAATVEDGQAATGFDFGSILSGYLPLIRGVVYRDANENGAQDAGELNQANYTVYLDANDNGQLDAGERSALSSANGYGFSGLLPGTYVVRVQAGFNAHVTSPSPADDGAHVLTVSLNPRDNRRDFGVAPVYRPASFGPIADAYVRDGDGAATNYGADPQLIVQQSDVSGSTYETYVRLDVANYPDVRSFKPRLYGRLVPGTGDGPVEVAAYAQGGGGSVLYNWTEANLTWDTRPGAANNTPLASVAVSGTDAKWYELDLSSYVRQLRSAGQQAIPIVLKAKTAGGRVAFASRNNPDATVRARQFINEDTVPPTVTQVLAGGTGWSKDFKLGLRARGLGAEGFVLPPGGAANPLAPRPLPWTNVNSVRVRFTEPVATATSSTVNTKCLWLRRADGSISYAATATFDTATLTGTWTWAAPLPPGRYTVELNSIVVDSGGNPVNAGAWLPLPLDILPGDADRNGRVNAFDLYDVRARTPRTAADPGTGPKNYSPFADVNADGRINLTDFNAVRARLFTTLPAAAVTTSAFAAQRVAAAAALLDSLRPRSVV